MTSPGGTVVFPDVSPSPIGLVLACEAPPVECANARRRSHSCIRPCELRILHLVTYENGMKLQQKLVELRQREEIADQLLLLEHPPVITLGRGGDSANLLASPEVL